MNKHLMTDMADANGLQRAITQENGRRVFAVRDA